MTDPNDDAPRTPAQNDGKPWTRVDEASWESFPASDAPASWAGRDRAPPEPKVGLAALVHRLRTELSAWLYRAARTLAP